MFNEFWVKIAAVAAFIAGLVAWRQKGIGDAVGQEKAKSRVKESIAHIKKMEKEKADAKTVHEIETLVSSLDDDESAERLRAFRE